MPEKAVRHSGGQNTTESQEYCMRREIMMEKIARITIFILAMVVLVCTAVFFVGTRATMAGVEFYSGEEYLDLQQTQLTKEEALEAALTAAQEENARLASENEALNQASISVLDNFMLEYVGEYYATAYCCEVYPHICGGNGVTASGTVPTPELTCAADWSVLPPGTWLYIEDVGLRRVEDSGSAIKGKRLDIAIDTHQNALRWAGQGNHRTWVLNFTQEEAEE